MCFLLNCISRAEFSDPGILRQTIEWKIIGDHGREEEGVGPGV